MSDYECINGCGQVINYPEYLNVSKKECAREWQSRHDRFCPRFAEIDNRNAAKNLEVLKGGQEDKK